MTEPLTIRRAADLLERRELSAVELVEDTLDRLDRTEPLVNAYCHVDRDRALDAARRADARPRVGLLQGIPFAVKDVLDVEGMPTTAGSQLLAGNVARGDAEAVVRLRAAGAIPLGKHVTHEFACGQNVPPTRNPWNLDCYPGGSSAGGGASVAVRSSLFALGTDGAGSVRKPAAVTGVVGLKATHGRVSGRGTVLAASSQSLDHVGIFAATVEDAALVLDAIAGYDPRDRRTAAEPVPEYRESLEHGISGLRVGIDTAAFFGPGLDPDVRTLAEAAVRELAELGATLVPVELRSLALSLPAAFTIFTAEVAVRHRRWIEEQPDGYVDATRHMLEVGLLLPAADLEAAHAARTVIREEVAAAFRAARLDVLATPTLPRPAIPLATMTTSEDVPRYVPYTAPWNLTGQPAISVPCGLTRAGLPAGLQIVGRPFCEPAVLQVAHAYERATAWHLARPGLAP